MNVTRRKSQHGTENVCMFCFTFEVLRKVLEPLMVNHKYEPRLSITAMNLLSRLFSFSLCYLFCITMARYIWYAHYRRNLTVTNMSYHSISNPLLYGSLKLLPSLGNKIMIWVKHSFLIDSVRVMKRTFLYTALYAQDQ